jgi:hypothetical protein
MNTYYSIIRVRSIKGGIDLSQRMERDKLELSKTTQVNNF